MIKVAKYTMSHMQECCYGL